ncbi:hypothetical protein Pla100_45760 [Neorhodopirellula pilleata]|uniref:Uncharacterized protein n=1 Tax=Neorhodopirellula pilleata TaxID=2714738 RepID=A0A5C6A035_9BACT|nr:hypothetical protein Pla100_45760 [Neorhodopirellula pilleata]
MNDLTFNHVRLDVYRLSIEYVLVSTGGMNESTSRD